jgi:hypothetical protein
MRKPTLSEITYIKRYTIGNYDPTNIKTEEEIQANVNTMNNELSSYKGSILGQEKNFINFNLGEHQVVMQYVVYHVGYRKHYC